jgi:hypothetical protein
MVPTVAFPPATPPADHVTDVFVELETVAENWKVCPTVKDEGAVPMAIVTAGAAVELVVVVFPPPPQPTSAISRLKLIAQTHADGRKPEYIDLTSIKPDFLSGSFSIAVSWR